jgi:hypothetical protein
MQLTRTAMRIRRQHGNAAAITLLAAWRFHLLVPCLHWCFAAHCVSRWCAFHTTTLHSTAAYHDVPAVWHCWLLMLHVVVLLCAAAVCCMSTSGTNPSLEQRLGGGYSWSPSSHPSFFAGRQASITARGQQVRGVHGAFWQVLSVVAVVSVCMYVGYYFAHPLSGHGHVVRVFGRVKVTERHQCGLMLQGLLVQGSVVAAPLLCGLHVSALYAALHC